MNITKHFNELTTNKAGRNKGRKIFCYTRLLAALFVSTYLIAPSSTFGDDATTRHTGTSTFQQKCAACHTIGGGDRIGPDLKNIKTQRDTDWLIRWIMHPDKMLAENDPTAVEVFNKYNRIPMPNLGVSEDEAKEILEYITSISSSLPAEVADATSPNTSTNDSVTAASTNDWFSTVQFAALAIFLVLSLIVIIVFWQVVASTKDPVQTIDMKTAYALRRKLFIGSSIIVIGSLAATLPFTPYKTYITSPDMIVYVAANQFSFTFSTEPITSQEELGTVQGIDAINIPINSSVEFRVTSLDATHGFAIYGPTHSIIAQTQAMPGYTNRLRVTFDKPGSYNVLCLEYCGSAHHLMRTSFNVQ